ncbi:MAG: RIP metalloprotease RseP [Alphaproteobacteria bacterium]|nr:RIP metalloprotease RseP [Alphaproteobacteria bacterium]
MTILTSVAAFLVVLTVLVFVHEMGHYLVARWRGVKVETFSIGFGQEIVGWTDRTGTRWKISWVPLGGYVKFFGDSGVSSAGPARAMTPAEREVSFHHKPLGSRAAVVVAGPAANFVFAILLFAGIYATVGQPFTTPVIAEVQPDTVAAQAGFRGGDRFVEIDGFAVQRFEDLMQLVLANPGRTMDFVVLRDGERMTLRAAPGTRTLTDRNGKERQVGYLGVRSAGFEQIRRNPAEALWYAAGQTWFVTKQTLVTVGRMIAGTAPTDDLRGPVGIAQLSGEVAQIGFGPVLELMALLSISLGLINLFPVPLLDGGHLLFYAFEAVRGRPLGPRAQEYGFRLGLALVLMLMVFATWNDFVQLDVVGKVRGLF